MALASRTDLQEYCLRRLGAPVIEINVDEQQVSDRVDDALQFWNEYHFDGTEKTYVKHEVTGSKLKLLMKTIQTQMPLQTHYSQN